MNCPKKEICKTSVASALMSCCSWLFHALATIRYISSSLALIIDSISLLFGALAVVVGVVALVIIKRNPHLIGRFYAIAGILVGGMYPVATLGIIFVGGPILRTILK